MKNLWGKFLGTQFSKLFRGINLYFTILKYLFIHSVSRISASNVFNVLCRLHVVACLFTKPLGRTNCCCYLPVQTKCLTYVMVGMIESML